MVNIDAADDQHMFDGGSGRGCDGAGVVEMKILYERGMLLFVVLYLRNELLAEVGAEVGVADGVGRYFRVAGIGQRFGGVVFDGDKFAWAVL